MNAVNSKFQTIFELAQLGDFSTPGLANGRTGTFAFLIEAWFQTEKKVFRTLALAQLNAIIAYEKKLPAPIPMLFGGSGGAYWALEKSRLLLPEIFTEELEDYRAYLGRSLSFVSKKYLSHPGRYELLSGALGISLLGLETGNEELRNIGDSHLRQYLESGDWKGPARTEQIAENNFEVSAGTNTGIAHGISAVLLYGTLLKERNIDPDLGEALISSTSKIIQEIEKNKTTKSIPSYFPSDLEPRSQSWCYGDPGIGFALLRASTVSTNVNKELAEIIFSRGISLFHEQQRPLFLCHGHASIALMLNSLGRKDASYAKSLQLLQGKSDSGNDFLNGRIGELLTLWRLDKPSASSWENLLFLGVG